MEGQVGIHSRYRDSREALSIAGHPTAAYGTAGVWDPWDPMGICSGMGSTVGSVGIWGRWRASEGGLRGPSHPYSAYKTARIWDPWDLMGIQSGIRSGIRMEGQVGIHSRHGVSRRTPRGAVTPQPPMGQRGFGIHGIQ